MTCLGYDRRLAASPLKSLYVAGLALLLSAACTQPRAEPPVPSVAPTATVKDLMQGLIDPSADVVWNAVATISDESGTEERMPRTDDEWAEVRLGAIRVIEGAHLLLMPGRKVTRPGEKSVAPGIELEGPEMEALIDKDRAAWNVRVRALHDAGLLALKAIEAKDAPTLFEVGEQIEHACEACHSQYWYPNQPLPPGFYPPGLE